MVSSVFFVMIFSVFSSVFSVESAETVSRGILKIPTDNGFHVVRYSGLRDLNSLRWDKREDSERYERELSELEKARRWLHDDLGVRAEDAQSLVRKMADFVSYLELPDGKILILGFDEQLGPALLIFNAAGRHVRTLDYHDFRRESPYSEGIWDLAMFHFPIGPKGAGHGVVVSWEDGMMGNLAGDECGYSFLFWISEDGEDVSAGPPIPRWGPPGDCGSGGEIGEPHKITRPLVGDINEDGFSDFVLWEKDYVWDDKRECVELKDEKALVYIFAPTSSKFMEPSEPPRLVPIDKKLWVNLGATIGFIWPKQPDLSAAFVPFCKGDCPTVSCR
jgi:hypothetical protein